MIKTDRIQTNDKVRIANGDWDEVTRGFNGSTSIMCKKYGAVRENTITEHIPSIDGNSVNQLDCFKHKDSSIRLFFLCTAPGNHNKAYVVTGLDDNAAVMVNKNDLIRYEKGDLINRKK